MDAIVLLREGRKTVEKLFKRFEKSDDDETVEKEVQDLFPDVRKAMGRNRLTDLGDELETGKKKAPREPLAVPSADAK
ncbi:hypothetical protein [Streptomyces sp. NPDC004330]|uniref:hypothetical protein n=1 Tax=Streptomyces sp. NPDC004330 TaxID=3364700 RepID=UPI00369A2464